MAKLGDLYKITSGGTPSRKHLEYYQDGTIPWIKTGDLKEKYLYITDENITEIGLNNSSARIYPKDTVLIAMYGATIGASSILKIEAATNQACAAFTKRDDIIPEYLYAFLESQQSRFINDAVGGAQPNISAGYLKEIDMPLIPIEEQQRIAALLDKVSDLIAKRRAQLEKLEDLVKSRFIELFGDPIENTLGLKTMPLGEVCYLKAGIATSADAIHEQSAEYPVPCYGGNGIRGYVEKATQSGCYPIIGRQGALCGNVQLATGNFHATEHAVLVTPLIETNVVWLFHLLKLMNLYRFHTGAAQPGLAVKTLNTVDIPIADILTQNQFATFVEQADKSKLTIQQSLDKLEVLKKALMQQYFG